MSVFDNEFKEKPKTKKKSQPRLPKVYNHKNPNGFLYGKKLEDAKEGKKVNK